VSNGIIDNLLYLHLQDGHSWLQRSGGIQGSKPTARSVQAGAPSAASMVSINQEYITPVCRIWGDKRDRCIVEQAPANEITSNREESQHESHWE
jgi:hypothetical protein